MTLNELIETLPAYAKDMRLNFSSVVSNQTELNEQQLWGTIVACAMTSRNEDLTAAALEEAASHLSEPALEAAKSAAAVMGMNNIFYRFLHLASNEKYKTMRAGLRMNVIRTHGIEPLDFELWCLAVSAINGCGACVDSHEKVLRDKGFGEEKVLAAVRVASVLHAIATVLDTQRVAAGEPVAA
jgi:alkyl hydroperoxide reductase subunit D